MLLSDFLKTVPELSYEQKRDGAKAHAVMIGNILEASTVNSLLQGERLSGIVKEVAADPTHPAYHDMVAIEYAMEGNHKFNFIMGTVAGDGAIRTLDRLIATDMSAYAAQLTRFLDTVVYLSNTVTYPLDKTELYDVLYALGLCPTKTITHVNGWYTVTTTADAPLHHPEIRALNTRTGKWQRVTSLYNLGAAGTYEQQIPAEWLGAELGVENVYGVL